MGKTAFQAQVWILGALLIASCSSFQAPEFRLQGMGYETDAPGAPAIESPGPLAFQSPLKNGKKTRGFKPRTRRPHMGLDLAAPKGTAVYAIESGRVIYQGRGFSGYGKMILIEHTGGFASLYSHLNAIHVREGQRIRQGQQIGEVGETGNARGAHLHLEIRYQKRPLDPEPYLFHQSLGSRER